MRERCASTVDIDYERILMEGIHDMIFVIKVENGDEFHYAFMNKAAIAGTGLTKNALGRCIMDVYPGEMAAFLIGQYKKVLAGRRSVTYQDRYTDARGIEAYSETTLNPLYDERGTCTEIIAIVKDITAEKHAQNEAREKEEQLQESHANLRIITENAHDLITLLDEKGMIIYTSPSYKKILGFDREEFIGKPFLHNVYPDDTPILEDWINRSINDGQSFNVQFRQYNQAKKLKWFESIGTPVFDLDQHLKHLVVLTRDITLKKEYEDQLTYFANYDPLTRLPNRRLLNKKFEKVIRDMQENGALFAVIMMDIDYFKSINDQLGHDVGDRVIQEFGERICKGIRANDMAARLGGDEFILLLPETETREEAEKVAEAIRESLAEPWHIHGQELHVTASMGIAIADRYDKTRRSIMKKADVAMYGAKRNGKNRYLFFGD